MKSENIPADIKSKSLKDTKDEINEILDKLENEKSDIKAFGKSYDRLMKLNKHVDNLFKQRVKEISSLGKKKI
jgi:exonuclease VII small subunit